MLGAHAAALGRAQTPVARMPGRYTTGPSRSSLTPLGPTHTKHSSRCVRTVDPHFRAPLPPHCYPHARVLLPVGLRSDANPDPPHQPRPSPPQGAPARAHTPRCTRARPHAARAAQVWWIHGNQAKAQGYIPPQGEFLHETFMSHRWFVWPAETDGNILGGGAAMMDVTVDRVGGAHVETIRPRCVDLHGACAQWAGQGQCAANPSYMLTACLRSCDRCVAVWDWLYELELGALHRTIACWAGETHDAQQCEDLRRARGGGAWPPPPDQPLRSRRDLAALPSASLDWLRGETSAAAASYARSRPADQLGPGTREPGGVEAAEQAALRAFDAAVTFPPPPGAIKE